MSKWIAVLSVLACVSGVGCSDAGSNGDESPTESTDAGSEAGAEDGEDAVDAAGDTGPELIGEPLPLGELAGAFATAYCAQIFDCCADSERANAAYGDSQTEADCVDEARSHFQLIYVSGVADAETEGRLNYNADKAGDCLARLEQSCDSLPREPAEVVDHCQAFLEPQLEVGDRCTHYFSCKTNHCDGVTTNPDDEEQDGTCAESEPGDVCQLFGCSESQYCDVDNNRGEFVCFSLKANGEACREPFECTSDFCGERDPDAGDFDGVCAPKPPTCTGSG
jgi:hypothetical protein